MLLGHVLIRLILLGLKLRHLLEATHVLMRHLGLAPHHRHHLRSLVKLGVMLTELWSLAVRIVMLRICGLIRFLVTLFDCEKNLAASIPQFKAIQAMTIFFIHLTLGLLSIFGIKIINECMGTIFCVCFCLLHPNSPHTPVLRKHFFESSLLWQLKPY